MNIFKLDESEKLSAIYQCDKHIVKMPLESAQMLSTAHRILSGKETKKPSKSGKTIVKYWKLDEHEDIVYSVAHRGHPCTIWTMQSSDNYMWHYNHFVSLSEEYKFRYKRDHLSYVKLKDILSRPPKNIPIGPLTEFPQAMPDDVKDHDPVKAYRSYYLKYKKDLATWKNGRSAPDWWIYE